MLFGQTFCLDCEPAQTNHFVMRTASWFGLALKPLLRPLNYLLNVSLAPRNFSWFDVAGPPALRALSLLRVGRLQREIAPDDSDRTRALWEEAARRDIRMTEFRCGPVKDLFIARFRGATRCFDGLPRPVGPEAESLYWMDNKAEMRRRFARAGIPVARGGACFSELQGRALFHSLRKPVIVKPFSGSRSRHTTVHLTTEEEFVAAFRKAKLISPKALIEEELRGFVFRGTLIGGNLAATMRREPPHVIGDGKHTIQELVQKENERPERRGPTFHPIATGEEAKTELKRQGFSFSEAPPKGAIVTLNQKVSRGIGASTTDVTGLVHPENKKLLERIGSLLKDPLVGVDLIMEDIGRPWQDHERCGVIECNSLPFIDLHHYPLNGSPRNVAGALWDIIFPDSKTRTESASP